MPRVAITIENPLNDYNLLLDYLRQAGYESEWLPSAGKTATEYGALIDGYDAVIAGGNPFDSQVLNKIRHSVRIIARYGIGVDKIDMDLATKFGIPITNTPGTMSSSVADLTVSLMLAIGRNVSTFDKKVKFGEWWQQYIGSELEGKTVGLIGFGQIAQKVVQYLKGFSCRILAFDKVLDQEKAKKLGVTFCYVEEIAHRADYISLHVPLNENTRHMINAQFLKEMKPTAYLINTSRGAVINESDLIQALRSRTIAGAALDVLENEPVDKQNPLLGLDNVIIIPHMGAVTKEVFEVTAKRAADNVIAFFKGEMPPDILNSDYKNYMKI